MKNLKIHIPYFIFGTPFGNIIAVLTARLYGEAPRKILRGESFKSFHLLLQNLQISLFLATN